MLSVATVIAQLIGFAALAIASRRLGPVNLGAYSFAFGVAMYLELVVNFGFTTLGIRDLARDPGRAREVMAEVLALRGVLSLVGAGAIVALAPAIAADPVSRKVLPITALMVITATLTFDWVAQGLQRLRVIAVARVAGQAIYGVLVPLLLVGGVTGAIRFAWLNVLGLAVTAAVTLVWTWRVAGPPFAWVSPRRLLRRLATSVPIGISLAVIQFYAIDAVMLGYLRNPADVGQFGVAYRVPLALVGFGVGYVAALYPHAAALFVEDRERLRRQVLRLASLGAALALPLGVGATVAGSGLMPVLFGSKYAAAGDPFVVLVWAVAVIVVSINFSNVLLACGDERRYALGVAVGAVLNVVLNLVLIPAYGTVGAAVSTLTAELAILAYMLVRFTRVLGPLRFEWGRIGRSAVATALMAGALLAIRDSVGAVPRCAIGAVLFAAFALALRVVTRSELAALLRRREVEAA
jgi:PST family polysaccharide transporter